MTSVDNVITEFVDDPRMLNVAVSRGVKSLTVVTSQDPQNDRTNYGDLARYIEYNNCAVIESSVYSVFDLLYQGYAEQRRAFLKKHGRVSEYDSENLLYGVILDIIQKAEFSFCGLCGPCVPGQSCERLFHVDGGGNCICPQFPWPMWISSCSADGQISSSGGRSGRYHLPCAGSVQASRDEEKNRIFGNVRHSVAASSNRWKRRKGADGAGADGGGFQQLIEHQHHPEKRKHKMNVICFGDSNTYGYDPRGYFGGGYDAGSRWVDILAAETGWAICNMGENGRAIPSTSPDFPDDTDLLIVMLGTNDLLQGRSPEQAAEKLEKFLSSISLEQSKLLLIAPPPVKLAHGCPISSSLTTPAPLPGFAGSWRSEWASALPTPGSGSFP